MTFNSYATKEKNAKETRFMVIRILNATLN